MRQVVKDRVARIDKQIEELKSEFAIRYAAEQDDLATGKKRFFGTANGSKMIFKLVEDLNAKREEIVNKAIFGSMQQTKYERGLEERKFNYQQALTVQKDLIDDIAKCMKEGYDDTHIRMLKSRLGNANRIVAIYASSLQKWVDKPKRVTITSDPIPLNEEEREEIENIQIEPDEDVQNAINAILAHRTGRVNMATNKTGIDLLMTQPNFELDTLIINNEIGDNKNNDPI